MIIGVPTEILEHEARVAVIPETVREYVRMGFEVIVQSHAGEGALKSDQEYREAGARIVPDAMSVFARGRPGAQGQAAVVQRGARASRSGVDSRRDHADHLPPSRRPGQSRHGAHLGSASASPR